MGLKGLDMGIGVYEGVDGCVVDRNGCMGMCRDDGSEGGDWCWLRCVVVMVCY